MENQEKKLLAGYAEVIITPPLGLRIPGYFSVRPAEGIINDLKARAVAFQYGEQKVIFLLCDAVNILTDGYEQLRDKIAARCEMDPDAVSISCNHSHTATLIYAVGQDDGNYGKKTELEEIYAGRQHQLLTDLAQFAFEDLHPVTAMKQAKGEAKGVGFLRRYRMKDGTCATNPVKRVAEIDHPEGTSDESLQMVRILREGAKEIVLINFGTHADVIGGRRFCADYTGFVCDYMKAALEDQVEVIDFVGCQGDSNHVDFMHLKAEKMPKGVDIAQKMARKIVGEALKIYDDAEDMTLDAEIRTKKVTVKIGKNPYDPADVPEAREICRLYDELGTRNDPVFRNFKLSVPEARRIIRNLDLPDFFDVTLHGISVGDFSFVGIPGEPFQQIGVLAKAKSPFAMTFLACCTNGRVGYFPSREAFAEKGYERSTSSFAWDCADIVTEGVVEALNEMKK
ncbi:MAG: hypothetical protein IKT50_04825 [Clostridia bacterium]|nr:hypothetical protein [Clostridia bacterium]